MPTKRVDNPLSLSTLTVQLAIEYMVAYGELYHFCCSARAEDLRRREEDIYIYIYIYISRAHFYTSLTIPTSPSSYEAGRPPPRGRPESLRVMTGRPPPRGRSEGPPPRGRGAGVPWVAGWKIKNMHNFFAKRHTGESASCVNSPALRIARASFRRDRRGPRQ